MFWEARSNGYKELIKPNRSRAGLDYRGNLHGDVKHGWAPTGNLQGTTSSVSDNSGVPLLSLSAFGHDIIKSFILID